MNDKLWNGPETGDPQPIIYSGGLLSKGGGTVEADVVKRSRLRYACLSYFYINSFGRTEAGENVLKALRQLGTRCFLDSGAYSYHVYAEKRKIQLTKKEAAKFIDGYAEWVKTSGFAFDFIVTFDYERDPDIVLWANKLLEEKHGLHPVPVYHKGTSITALRKLIDRGYSLIGIGGLLPYHEGNIRHFLDHVFNVTERHSVRCHGFGMGGQIMLDYPWFSVDSSSPVQVAKRGDVFRTSLDPRKVYDVVPVSSRSTAVRSGRKDCREDRIVDNLQLIDGLMDLKRPPVRFKKGLF